MSILEWSNTHRFLAAHTTKEYGPYSSFRTPYVHGIMAACEIESGFSRIVVKKSTQLGITELGLNFIGRALSQGLGPTMIVLPKKVHARSFSRKRVSPMIDLSPDLQSKILSLHENDKDNSLTEKRFLKSSLFVAGCNKDDLRSDPIKYVVFEEVSNFPKELEDQGDPVDIAWNRTKSFIGDRKGLFISTPTNKKNCRITKEWEESNKSYFHVPCPNCNHMQRLIWEQIKFDVSQPKDARYECINCQYLIPHDYKTQMLSKGEWIVTVPEQTDTAGFHLSALYAAVGLGDSWGDLAEKHLKIGEDFLKKKDFLNNYLGEAFEIAEDQIEWETLYERREHWDQRFLPDDVRYITMGVDVQKSYLAYEIVGWTRGMRSYSLEYSSIDGDTAEDQVWDDLLLVINRVFKHSSGTAIRIAKTGIDTGFRPAYVYKFLRRANSMNVHAIDGRDGDVDYYVGSPVQVDVENDGSRTRYGLKVHPIGTHVIKSELFGWLRLRPNEDGTYPSGYLHFPNTHSAEYFKELTAEEIAIEQKRNGADKLVFRKVRKRNEALDCRCYARGMAFLLGLDQMTDAEWHSRNQIFIAKEESNVD
jgi:phage terminase large subunit GpA-like protein